MRRLRTEASKTLYVGDETRDIEAAREVRVASGAVTWGYANAGILATFTPTLTFDAMEDILALVGGEAAMP